MWVHERVEVLVSCPLSQRLTKVNQLCDKFIGNAWLDRVGVRAQAVSLERGKRDTS